MSVRGECSYDARRRWRGPWLAAFAIAVAAWLSWGRRPRARRLPAPAQSAELNRSEGRYDVRRGAAGYSPVIGTFGALAVPAIIVLFTVPRPPGPQQAPWSVSRRDC